MYTSLDVGRPLIRGRLCLSDSVTIFADVSRQEEGSVKERARDGLCAQPQLLVVDIDNECDSHIGEFWEALPGLRYANRVVPTRSPPTRRPTNERIFLRTIIHAFEPHSPLWNIWIAPS